MKKTNLTTSSKKTYKTMIKKERTIISLLVEIEINWKSDEKSFCPHTD